MNDTLRAGPGRCAAVWVVATLGLGALLWLVVPDLARAQAVLSGPGAASGQPFDRMLVSLCAAVSAAGAAWLWVVTTVVTLDAARGRTRSRTGVPAALRRLVLAACGLALAGGVALPAVATPGQLHQDRTGPATRAVVQGLPLPDRAGSEHDQAASPERVVVVRPGDTLWALAARELPASADAAAVSTLWHRIHELNRDVIGADPDLIHPDQRLRLPRR